jgi:ribosomal protein S18 acetylase RimI-like enzyme
MVCLRAVLGAPPGGMADILADIEARPASASDQSFLRHLHETTRSDEMRALGWSASRCRAFLDQQFESLQRGYQEQYPGALCLLLLQQGQAIGCLQWHSTAAEATLIDLSLLPPFRGRGLGSAILGLLSAEADRLGLSIVLHVEPGGLAQQLYQRFGFDIASEEGMYVRMRRPAAQPASTY